MKIIIQVVIASFFFCVYTSFILGQEQESVKNNVALIVLGNVQDAGAPHIACRKSCCQELFENGAKRNVVSLGLIDHRNEETYLFEASPDIAVQMKMLKREAIFSDRETPNGIVLTHAHIGHYTGLMYLGKEAMNAGQVPVYVMPKMKSFLEMNGPWSQLVKEENIVLQPLENNRTIEFNKDVRIVPIQVPHRDEFSETVGFKIIGPNKSALFIPDIDKWSKWNESILDLIRTVDYAFIDGTFYDAQEINYRDISEIPHPFIVESMDLFSEFRETEKAKIYFIHFNHTNPALNEQSEASQTILNNGFHIARIGMRVDL